MIKKLPQPSPADGIATIRYSMRCFGFGLASSLPIIGLPLALLIAANSENEIRAVAFGFTGLIPLVSLPLAWVAAVNHRRARTVSKNHWNPARSYLVWGRVLSALGVFSSLLIIFFFACVLMGLLPWRSGNLSQFSSSGDN